MSLQGRNLKYLFNGLISILLIIAVGFSACAKPAPAPAPEPAPAPAPTPAPAPAPTPTPAPTPETTTYTAVWAKNQVSAYLNSLAKGPDAIRYLAELQSQGYFESRFSQSEVDQDLGGHKYSGWQVYYRLTDRPSKEYWDNLNWAVCKDGYVAEGSNDALLVKADLMELSQSPAPAPAPAPKPAPAPVPQPQAGPVILSPQGGAITGLSPTINWTPLAGVTKYEIILATDATLTNRVGGTPITVSSTAWQPGQDLDYNTVYFFGIRAVEPDLSPQSIGTFQTMSP